MTTPNEKPEGGAGSLWRGLGIWNVYFILKFALAHFGYISLQILWNALLLAGLLLPIPSRALRIVRWIVALPLAIALLYSESWLPGIESFTTNAQAIRGFSLRYVAEFVVDFINPQMLGWSVLTVILYFLLRNYLRISLITTALFCWVAAAPLVQTFESGVPGAESASGETKTAAQGEALTDAKTVEAWYQAFLEYEKDRRAEIPQGLSEKDTPFDILIVNICSLANDDLQANNLEDHPLFSKFNIRFDHFNGATGYSGPAALRLLTCACGQTDHNTLYDERRPECELLTRLETLGYKQDLYMDHLGEYDNFLQSLRDKAGLTAKLASDRPFPVRYMGFDDEPISDDLAVLRQWQKTIQRSTEKRTVTFMNLISLHDGNRYPRQGRPLEFKPRAKQLLDDLQTFTRELERSGRRVMLLVVPEHGAAVRGDKIQPARLRDIPSFRITEVPVGVKFFGIKQLPGEPIHVTGTTSYMALATLIGRALETNYFSQKGGAVPLDELVRDLPETNFVSENAQSQVLRYQGRDYLRRGTGDWQLYP